MAKINITFTKNGPMKIQGEVSLKDHDGRDVKNAPAGDVALCRCGASKNKPFCDGAHVAAGFDGTLAN